MRAGWGLLLLLCVPMAPAEVSLVAEPAAGAAPLDVVLHAASDVPVESWWMFYGPTDNATKLAAGTALPSEVPWRFGPGSYEVHLVANTTGGQQAASTMVEVAPLELLLTASTRTGVAPLEVVLQAWTPHQVDAPWTLHVASANETQHIAGGTQLPATLQVTFPSGSHHVVLSVDAPGGPYTRNLTVSATDPVLGVTAELPWVSGDVLPLAFAGLLMLGLAVWLVVRDPGNRLNIAFSVLFIARGLADLTNALLANSHSGRLALDPAWMERLHPTVTIAVVAAAAYFVVVYMGQNNARIARLRAAPVTAGLGLSVVALALWQPSLYWGRPGAVGGILFAFTGLYYPIYTLIVYLLVRESRKDIPDDRRTGAFTSALGFLFLPAFVGAGELLFVDVVGFLRMLDAGTGVGFAVGHWAAVLSLVPLGMAAAVMVRAAHNEPERRHTRLHAGLFLGAIAVAIGSLLLPLMAYMGSGDLAHRSAAVADLFWVFQGIWAIPYAVLVAWGLTRYQASSQQTQMRRQLGRFAAATLFFTVFFAVSEGLEGLAASRWGNELGLVTAAILTVVLGPVQERVQKRFVAAAPEQETSQEVRFYEEQLRRTLMDGFVGEHERRFLDNLRITMGISDETAASIEARLQAT